MSDQVIRRPRALRGLHGIAALLSLGVFVLRDVDSPDIGFPIAIAILAGLGIRAAPKPNEPEILRLIHGGFLQGGIRQGAFIKAMFAVALLYLGTNQFFYDPAETGVTNVLLGVSLGMSSIASEIEAWDLRRRIDRSH